MDELKVYTNKNIGSFLSIPASKIAQSNNLEDSIYFSRHLNKLRHKSIEELRGTKHYKSKTQQYAKYLEGIDTTSLKDMSTKLKLNIKMYNPLAKTDPKYKEGGSVRKSYKTIELLKVSKNSFKPMLFLGGTPNAAARSFIGFQQPRLARNAIGPGAVVKPLKRQAHSVVSQNQIPGYNPEIKESLINDFVKLVKAVKGEEDASVLLSEFMSNAMYDKLFSQWDPTNILFEDLDDLENDNDQLGGGGVPITSIVRMLPKIINYALSVLPELDLEPLITLGTLVSKAGIKAGLKSGIFILRIPEHLIKRQEKNLYMVLLAKADEKGFTYKSVRAVGVLLSKNKPENIKSLGLSQRTLLKWFSFISGSPEKWAFSIGNQLRTDIKISIEDVDVLKGQPSTDKDRLLQKLMNQFSEDLVMSRYLKMVAEGDMDPEIWNRFQAYASISDASRSTANSNDTINSIVGILFSTIFASIIMLVVYLDYKLRNLDGLDHSRPLPRRFLRQPGFETLESLEKQTLSVVDTVSSDLKTHFYKLGEFTKQVYQEGIEDTINKYNLKRNFIAGLFVSLSQFMVNYAMQGNLSQEQGLSISTHVVSYDGPKPTPLTEALSNFNKMYGWDKTEIQEAIRDNCIADLSYYNKVYPEYQGFFGMFRNEKELDRLARGMISTTLKCEMFLNGKYKQAVHATNIKYKGKYYGSKALLRVSGVNVEAIELLEEVLPLAQNSNLLRLPST